MNKLIAKSIENGMVSLREHEEMVANEASVFMELITPETDSKKKLVDMAYIAGLLHDCGKSTKTFQDYLNGTENHPEVEHNVIGAMYVAKYYDMVRSDNMKSAKKNKLVVLKSVMHHHSFSNELDYKKVIDSGLLNDQQLKTHVKELVEFINSQDLYFKFEGKEEPESTKYVFEELQTYLNTDDRDTGTINYHSSGSVDFLILSNVIRFADAKASGLDYNILRDNDVPQLKRPAGYDDRFDLQSEFARDLFNHNFSVFNSQTGFGKTMLALLYAMMNNRRTYWVCPRNIARNIHQNLIRELKALNIRDKVSTGLLIGGKWEAVTGNFDPSKKRSCPDIVVTNIDNFLNPVISANHKERTFDILHANVIFDEYHEYVTDQEIMAHFKLMLDARATLETKTLLMSATDVPFFHYAYSPDVSTLYNKCHVVRYDCEKILSRKLRLKIVKKAPKNKIIGTGTLACTAGHTQCVNIHDNGQGTEGMIHGRYSDSDLKAKFDILDQTHGKHSKTETSWATTNMITTGADYSFSNLSMSFPTPNRLLQTLGRIDRWGEMQAVGIYPTVTLYADPKDYSEVKAINTIASMKMSMEFMNFLKKKFPQSETGDGQLITLKDMYDARDEFINTNDVCSQFFNDCFKTSNDRLEERKYRRTFKTKEEKPDVKRISKNGLRKNPNITQFFAKFVHEDTGKYMEEPIATDTWKVKVADFTHKTWEDIAKSIYDSPERELYFNVKHKQAFENMIAKDGFIKDLLMNKAMSSDTPIPIPKSMYKYSSANGYCNGM